MSGEPEGSGARPAPGDGWRGRWAARARTLGDAARSRTRRFWAGARPTLRQLWWTEEPATPVTTVDRRFPEPLVAPAQGQVYVFLVRATFTWSSDTARPELFGWYVDYFQPQATQRLHRLALRCAVEVPPHRPRELLSALTAALAADDPPPWTYARGEVTFACEPDVTVQLDERVRQLLQPYWERRIALECERDLARRRAEYAQERDRNDPPRPDPPRPDPPRPDPPRPDPPRPDPPRPDPAIPVRPPRDSTRPASPRRGPRPDAPTESFTPLEPLLPPPTPRPAPDQNPPPPPAR